jgi:3-ketosteroid 9alpha-monooxygenase subunit A
MGSKSAEYGFQHDFPRGWFMVAKAADVGDKPLAVRFLGHDFALYRGKSGKAVLLDAYCPHMGTHLTKNTTSYVIQDGQVEGDSIRCPYHAWRFGPDGKCDHIPYYDGPIPKAAAVKAWPIAEQMGIIWVWHDPECGAPDYPAPLLEEWNNPRWIHWRIEDLGLINTHPQEIVDNMADVAHFVPLHGSDEVTYFEFGVEQHRIYQKLGVTSKFREHETISDTYYEGPGILISRNTAGPDEGIILIANTPVEDGTTQVWTGFLVRSQSEVANDADRAEASIRQDFMKIAVTADFEVWEHKIGCTQVMQIPTDGPFDRLRVWYKQFYMPRSKEKDFHKAADGWYTVRGTPAAPKKAAE